MTKLKYTECLPTTFQGAPFVPYQFRGNSLFDPNSTGVGHQPRGFDQLKLLYARYRVNGCKIQVSFMASTSASAAFGLCGIMPTNNGTTGISIADYTENPRCQWKPITSTNNAALRFKQYRSTRQVMGLVKGQKNNEDYSALIDANPVKDWFWEIFQGSLDGIEDIASEVVVTLTYYATFYDRVDLDQS